MTVKDFFHCICRSGTKRHRANQYQNYESPAHTTTLFVIFSHYVATPTDVEVYLITLQVHPLVLQSADCSGFQLAYSDRCNRW